MSVRLFVAGDPSEARTPDPPDVIVGMLYLLSQRTKKSLTKHRKALKGDPSEARTPDPLLKRQMLYLLS